PDPAEPGSEDKDLRHRDERLRDLVDGMEQDVEEERREDDAPGNVDERERTSSVEPDDQAPTSEFSDAVAGIRVARIARGPDSAGRGATRAEGRSAGRPAVETACLVARPVRAGVCVEGALTPLAPRIHRFTPVAHVMLRRPEPIFGWPELVFADTR